jgi:hypothetical protein
VGQGGGDGADGGREELARRLNQNNHFARTAVQLAELSTHRRCEQLRGALTAAQP